MPAEYILIDVVTKGSGIQRILTHIENIGHEVLARIPAALTDVLQSPRVFHTLQTELMGLDFF